MNGNNKKLVGFTLIEMLLVLVLIGIISAITIPQFVNSMRGNRLRVAVKSVVMAGRYARSMAVMKQNDILLSFDIDNGIITVDEVSLTDAVAENLLSDESDAPERGETEAPKKVLNRTELLSRKLDQVVFEYVEIDGDTITSKSGSVIYSSNGRCTPYSVKVSDETGKSVVVEVDALSTAKTEGSE
jgi:prepilin-type N-terminal cleavage/methylation domain-containing protein